MSDKSVGVLGMILGYAVIGVALVILFGVAALITKLLWTAIL